MLNLNEEKAGQYQLLKACLTFDSFASVACRHTCAELVGVIFSHLSWATSHFLENKILSSCCNHIRDSCLFSCATVKRRNDTQGNDTCQTACHSLEKKILCIGFKWKSLPPQVIMCLLWPVFPKITSA